MNESYSYSHTTDQLLGFDDVDRSYRVDHMTDEDCPICNKKLKPKTVYDAGRTDSVCANCLTYVIPDQIIPETDDTPPESPVSPDEIPIAPLTKNQEKEFGEKIDKSYGETKAKQERVDKYGSGTVIGGTANSKYQGIARDAKGKPIKSVGIRIRKDPKTGKVTRTNLYQRMAATDRQIIVSKHDRNWKTWHDTVMKEIEELLPGPNYRAVRDGIIILFKKCLRKKLLHGRNFLAFLASCIQIEMKRFGMDVSDYNKMDKELQGNWKKTITEYNHLIQTECILGENPDTNLPHNSPEKYVQEITNAVCTAMKIDNHEEISSTASKILNNAKVFGKNPKKLAAAAVYLSCKEHECEIDIYKMVKIVETSSATIKSIARELNDELRLGISL